MIARWFDIDFHFVGWNCLSLGAHLDLLGPFVEVHLPFCFVTIGWRYARGLGGGSWHGQDSSAWRRAAHERAIARVKQAGMALREPPQVL